MIRSYNQLVPFGEGQPQPISTLLIGNLGPSGRTGLYSYLALYHEQESQFSEGITKFKLISDYDRRNALFFLLEEIYSGDDPWLAEESIRDSVGDQHVDVLLQRLREANE